MGFQTVQIPVGGMTCGNCARAVERSLSAYPGVSTARVDLAKATATVEFDADRTGLPDLLHVIAQLGYTAQQ
jgi:copper chaperone CopZ